MIKKLRENKRLLLLSAIFVLLILNILMMENSFARYKETVDISKNATVLEFDPEVGGFDEWSGDMPMSEDGESSVSFSLRNMPDVSSNLIVVLDVEGEFPLEYKLKLKDGTVVEGEKEGNVYTYVVPMSAGTTEADFLLISKWNAPYYDERVNMLSEDINLKIICEQSLEGETE